MAENSSAETRSVELGRNRSHLDEGDDNRTPIDDVLSPPSSPRNLLLDATTLSSHSSSHKVLRTSYYGDVPSTSIEFTLENHNADGEYAIISGLGLNVRIFNADDPAASDGGNSTVGDEASASAMVGSSPCRVKVYTKRGEGLHSAVKDTGTISVADITAYRLALDARVLCTGAGKETLLPSELFAASYRTKKGPVVGETGDTTGNVTAINGGTRDRRTEEGIEQFDGVESSAPGEVASYIVESTEGGTNSTANLNSTTAYDAVSSYGLSPDQLGSVESSAPGEVASYIIASAEGGTDVNATSNATNAYDAVTSYGLTPEDKGYPLLIPSNETLSLYIVLMALDEATAGKSFLLLSSSESTTPTGEEKDTAISEANAYIADTTLSLYSGLSIINGYKLNGTSRSSSETVDEQKVLQVTPGAKFNGAVYYDTFLPTSITLEEYYDAFEYSLLPDVGLQSKAVCEKSFKTGLTETVGSYGIMFDVSSNIDPNEDDSDGEGTEGSALSYNDVEIFGMDFYILNLEQFAFEVFIRKNTEGTDHRYMSYTVVEGQTLISTAWDMIATGTVDGRGAGNYTPIPIDAWKKTVFLRPGETVGFYVTVKNSPFLRYRNSSLPEGNIFKSDGILNVGVGRSWGEYPLREDGTDVFFAQREFSGAFHYRLQEGLCPSAAPSISASPTANATNPYAKEAEAAGLCPEESSLETTFAEGTGSYGALFDIYAETKVMLTGIDLNVDWITGTSANVLVYARAGSWYGHQNSAESWPHLLVNTTLSRPAGFHNKSTDGPYIDIDQKRKSAIVPRSAFTPLEMKTGEVWAIYVCTSLADVRYTLGTKLGAVYASNPELRVMQGAGAADYPPFLSGTPATKGVEYTFYTPRLFNGNLRYDHIAECASTFPSSMFSIAPTATPVLTTNVTYTFYVEHSPEKSWSVHQDMSSGVRAVLNRLMRGEDDVLHGYVIDDELAIESVVANGASPDDIGYICYPTPPDTCTPISVLVKALHHNTVSSDDVMYGLLRQSIHLPSLIVVEGYIIQYIGERAAETNSVITVSGVPSREMGDSEQKFFANAARDFLTNQLSSNDKLSILSVTINGQEIAAVEASTIMPRSEEEWNDPIGGQYRSHPGGRRRLEGTNNVLVSVKGSYTPPPDIDFGDVVETSINSGRDLLAKELKKPPPTENGVASNYFEEAEVEGARQIKSELIIVRTEDNKLRYFLNLVAMALGGLLGMLSIAFFLRPHRRRAIFPTRSEDMSIRLRKMPVNEDQQLLKKFGANETVGTDIDNSFRSSDADYTEHALRLSAFSSHPPVIDSRARYTRHKLSVSSFTRVGSGPPPPGQRLNISYRSGTAGASFNGHRGGPGPLPPGQSMNSSYRSGTPGERPSVTGVPNPPHNLMIASFDERRGGPGQTPPGVRPGISYNAHSSFTMRDPQPPGQP